MATYTDISIQEMREALPADKGWKESQFGKEYIFDWQPGSHPLALIRVYTSIHVGNQHSRGVGRDAIRVCALIKRGNQLSGLIRSRRVHRVAGWRSNLTARVLTVRNEMFRKLSPRCNRPL